MILSSLTQAGADFDSHDLASFKERFDEHFPNLFKLFTALYGDREDCVERLINLITVALNSWQDRPDALKELDRAREATPNWFQSNKMIGAFCYVDRFAGDLRKLQDHVPYLKELGVTYLHLMPFFDCPKERSDGGYAVSSYRDVRSDLGTMEDVRALADLLRENGISLVADFVFNHTSNEHEWAKKAAAGDPEFSDYYWIFDDRRMPDAFERTVREVFPDDHPGAFIQLPDGRWIWSTFHSFQWDLNYSNPAVFNAMAGEMLALANQGVDLIRMDAVAFIWKRLGTTCESQPEAHLLLQAFNSVCRIAAPSLLFKSEAIVHPDEVVSYIDPHECQISYNPLLMALSWEALATRNVALLDQAITMRQALDPNCAWVNYVRSHDDIGWTFADEDAAELGILGFDHRRFLNAFYSNQFEGSFARGVPFQFNPKTGDCRVCGTTAALTGVEAGDAGGIDRFMLLYGIAFSAGGIPLLSLGDEVGQLNDHSYLDHPSRASDSRWVGRPFRPDDLYDQRHDPNTTAGQIFAGMQRLIAARKSAPGLAGNAIAPFPTGNTHVLGYTRSTDDQTIHVLANFADDPQDILAQHFIATPPRMTDLITGEAFHVRTGITLPAHRILWLSS
ncbi:alpha-amylase family glycosyl hydrolase [Cognatiyoonia koreensis]|uniref:alpha-amylase family glycosyl hydrolase n=1 Tax=Cognatiyoonia koreensis TaxID=364200 RepID=UPI001A96EF8B|nr:alpha-amylase family glycosyl hydrolase [Cognatiyoonia koreensis]